MRPITDIEVARRRNYGPTYDPQRYREGGCCETIFSDFRPHQCARKSGHGPGSLYCKQHATIAEKCLAAIAKHEKCLAAIAKHEKRHPL